MTRDARLIAAFILVTVLAAALVGTRYVTNENRLPVQTTPVAPPLPAVMSRNVAVGADGKLSLLWAGDTMLGGDATPAIARFGQAWPLQRVRPLLRADFTLVNYESPITRRVEPWDRDESENYAAP